MKKLFWFSAGIVGGLLLAHKLSNSERGQAFLDSVNERSDEFQTAVRNAYESREAQLKSALEQFQDDLSDFNK